MIRKARLAEGAAWFVDSFRLAGRCWRLWWPASALCALAGWVCLRLPLAGPLLVLPLNFLLTGCMMRLADQLERGNGGLGAVLRDMGDVAGRLLLLGGVAFGAGLAVLGALALLAWSGLHLLDLTGALPPAPPDIDRYGRFLLLVDGSTFSIGALRWLFLLFFLIVVAALLLLMPLFWLAPTRVALAGAGIRRAMADSWTACWRNMWPMFLCSALMAGCALAALLFSAAALGLAGFGRLPFARQFTTADIGAAVQLFIGVLYAWPLGYMLLYVTHREVFAADPADSGGG